MHSPRSRIDDSRLPLAQVRSRRARPDRHVRHIETLAELFESSSGVPQQDDEDLAALSGGRQGVATLRSADWLAKARRDMRHARLHQALRRLVFFAVFGFVLFAA